MNESNNNIESNYTFRNLSGMYKSAKALFGSIIINMQNYNDKKQEYINTLSIIINELKKFKKIPDLNQQTLHDINLMIKNTNFLLNFFIKIKDITSESLKGGKKKLSKKISKK
jgi:hypothetical protein